jgi:hypothetical protein
MKALIAIMNQIYTESFKENEETERQIKEYNARYE